MAGSEEERQQVEEKAKVQRRKRETEFKVDRHERRRTGNSIQKEFYKVNLKRIKINKVDMVN